MKIYIGGISSEVTDSELQDLYGQYGKVRKVDLLKDEAGINRGYAFIEMDDPQAAESAILGTHNTLLGGNNIQVSISRSRLDQKRDRQKKNNGKFRSNDRPTNPKNRQSNHNPKDQRNNREFNSNNDTDIYNRIDHKPSNIKKGIDYGRNANTSSPQMSFLGQEGFATSIRTVDPVYSSNGNNRRPENSQNNGGKFGNYRNNNNNRRNNFKKKPGFNNKRFEKKDKTDEKNDSIFQPNTSDIIGNLE